MSVTKNKETKFSATPADVKFKLHQLNIRNINDKPNVVLHTVLVGAFANTTGEVDRFTTDMGLQDILAGFSAAEKTAASVFLKAVERTAATKIPTLAEELHDSSDVFA